MSIQGRTPVQPVPIFVTYDALAELDPTNVGDLYAALENFDHLRDQAICDEITKLLWNA
jgi:hypothetical protein